MLIKYYTFIMIKGWYEIKRDIFSIIALYLDGRDGTRCAAVSKNWRKYVLDSQNKDLHFRMKMHYVRIYNNKSFQKCISPNMLKECTAREYNHVLDYIFWYRYGVNWRYFIKIDGINNNNSIFNMFGYVENGRDQRARILLDSETNDIILINDFYGNFTWHQDELKKFESHVNHLYDINKNLLPGLFEWRFIGFSLGNDYREYHVSECNVFHRGSCILFRFKTNGILIQDSIRAILNSWRIPPAEIGGNIRPKRKEEKILEFLKTSRIKI